MNWIGLYMRLIIDLGMLMLIMRVRIRIRLILWQRRSELIDNNILDDDIVGWMNLLWFGVQGNGKCNRTFQGTSHNTVEH